MRPPYIRKRRRHDGAESGVKSARTVGNVEMGAALCLGISDVES